MDSRAKFAVYNAQNIVVLTGAGISKDSGIETFREYDGSGMWDRFDPMKLSSMNGFMEDPQLVWDWYKDRRDTFIQAQPNMAHTLLAELEKKKNVTIVTQNIDDLHERAGSTNVIHLHGKGDNARCTVCDWHGTYEETFPGKMPQCPECDELARPDVVWFGENLDMKIYESAYKAFDTADLCIVIGTSSDVEPAASLPKFCSYRNRDVISINTLRDDHSWYATIKLTGKAANALGMIL